MTSVMTMTVQIIPYADLMVYFERWFTLCNQPAWEKDKASRLYFFKLTMRGLFALVFNL